MKKDRVNFKRCWNEYTQEWETVAVIHGVECNPGNIMTYMHIGQHGEGQIAWVNDLPDCPPVDYADMQTELISIGYNLAA